MDPIQREMSERRAQEAIRRDRRIADLRQRLLVLGGETGVWVPNSLWMDALLVRGTVFSGESRLRYGQMKRCHFNSARLWAAARERRQLVTG